MQLTHGSFSSFSSYLRCGHAYALQKKHGVREAPAWYLMGGSAVHEASEWIDEDGPANVTEADCHDYFKAAFQEQVMPNLERWKPEDFGASKTNKRDGSLEDGEWWDANGGDMLWNYVQWRLASDWQILHLDGTSTVEFGMEPQVNGFPIKMFIDRLFVNGNGEIIIMDIKTGKSMPRHSLQLSFYAWGLRQLRGLNVDLGVFYNPRKNTMSPTYDIRNNSYAVGIIADNWRKAVEADHFLPNLENCVSCNLAHACYFGSGNLNDPEYSPALQNKGM